MAKCKALTGSAVKGLITSCRHNTYCAFSVLAKLRRHRDSAVETRLTLRQCSHRHTASESVNIQHMY